MNSTAISRDKGQFKESTEIAIQKENSPVLMSIPGSFLTEMKLVFYPEDYANWIQQDI